MAENIFLAIIIFAVAFVIAAQFIHNKKRFCLECGHLGATKTKAKGSIALEILLWLLLIIPGLIYSLWRLSSKFEICSECGSNRILPLTSPVAQKMMKELGISPTASSR